MVLREILRALERIEENQRTLLERGGTEAAPRGEKSPQRKGMESAEEWMQVGIDNILSYQVGEKADKR